MTIAGRPPHPSGEAAAPSGEGVQGLSPPPPRERKKSFFPPVVGALLIAAGSSAFLPCSMYDVDVSVLLAAAVAVVGAGRRRLPAGTSGRS